MKTFETQFGIGDVVYTANAYGVERQIVTKVKIEGLRHKVFYGFKEPRNWFLGMGGSDDTGYASSDIFETEEEADRRHKSLKLKRETQKRKEEQMRLAERKKKLEEDLAKLESGDFDDIDDLDD